MVYLDDRFLIRRGRHNWSCYLRGHHSRGWRERFRILYPLKTLKNLWWWWCIDGCLGVTIDKKPNFDIHIASICLKVKQKLNVLGRLVKLLLFNKKQLLFETFEFQFKYWSLIWIFCVRKSNNWLRSSKNRVQWLRNIVLWFTWKGWFIQWTSHKRSSTFNWNILSQVKCIKKCFSRLLTKTNANYNLRCKSDFNILGTNTVYYEENSIRYFWLFIWYKVLYEIRKISDLNRFKAAIKKWKPSDWLPL